MWLNKRSSVTIYFMIEYSFRHELLKLYGYYLCVSELTGTFLSSCILYCVRKCGLFVRSTIIRKLFNPQNATFVTNKVPVLEIITKFIFYKEIECFGDSMVPL